jgi:hypothetical protein
MANVTWRGNVTARFQYQTVQEALGAQVWLETWQQQNAQYVRPAGTMNSVIALIPPTPASEETGPACNGQLSMLIEMEGPDQATVDAAAQQIGMALGHIIAEGGVFDCYGDSGFGLNPE